MGPWTTTCAVNRANWNERAAVHAASADYGFERFISDPTSATWCASTRPCSARRSGLRGIHLQCHIGTDTLSLARLGAEMAGLDLSPASLDKPTSPRPAEPRSTTSRPTPTPHLRRSPGGGSTLVYTGIGALCWLPDIDRWAGVVDNLLEPGGQLFVREGHPMLWAFDDMNPDVLTLQYAYFETPEPFDIEEEGTYVESDHRFVP